jgi:hypothetical protein
MAQNYELSFEGRVRMTLALDSKEEAEEWFELHKDFFLENSFYLWDRIYLTFDEVKVETVKLKPLK